MIALRSQFSCLQQLSLLDDQYQLHGDKHQVHWYLLDATPMQEQHWHQAELNCCMLEIINTNSQQSLLVLINGSARNEAVLFPGNSRQLVFDTALDDGLQPVKPLQASQWLQTAHSLSVWQ